MVSGRLFTADSLMAFLVTDVDQWIICLPFQILQTRLMAWNTSQEDGGRLHASCKFLTNQSTFQKNKKEEQRQLWVLLLDI